MAAPNRRTKYWKIAAQQIWVERQRYMYKDGHRSKPLIRQLLHEINLGWKDDIPTVRKQYPRHAVIGYKKQYGNESNRK